MKEVFNYEQHDELYLRTGLTEAEIRLMTGKTGLIEVRVLAEVDPDDSNRFAVYGEEMDEL